MTMTTGNIEAITDKFGKFNVLLDDGRWYSTKMEWKPKMELNKGDSITFDAGPTGKYLQKVKKNGGGSVAPSSGSPSAAPQKPVGGRTFPIGALAPERTINRQNALTNAVNYLTGGSPEEVIEVAKMFEAYTTGDLDAIEAQEAMKALEGGHGE